MNTTENYVYSVIRRMNSFSIICQAAPPTLQNRTLEVINHGSSTAIFELGLPHQMWWRPESFVMISLTVQELSRIRANIQTCEQSHRQTLLKTIPPSLRYAAWMTTIPPSLRYAANNTTVTMLRCTDDNNTTPTARAVTRNNILQQCVYYYILHKWIFTRACLNDLSKWSMRSSWRHNSWSCSVIAISCYAVTSAA